MVVGGGLWSYIKENVSSLHHCRHKTKSTEYKRMAPCRTISPEVCWPATYPRHHLSDLVRPCPFKVTTNPVKWFSLGYFLQVELGLGSKHLLWCPQRSCGGWSVERDQ